MTGRQEPRWRRNPVAAPVPAADPGRIPVDPSADAPDDRGPGAVRALAGHHASAIIPWTWAAAAAVAGFASHAVHGGEPRLIMAGSCAVCAGIWAAANVVGKKRSRRVRRAMALSWGAGVTWTATATAWGPVAGPHHAELIALAAGSAAVIGQWRYAIGRKPAPAAAARQETPALPAAAHPDLVLFREKFDKPGSPLHRAHLTYTPVTGGFTIDALLDPDSQHTTTDVQRLAPQMAKHYDVPFDQAVVEDHPHRSAARARITLLTATGAMMEPEPWDGVSTYNPATGTVDLGRFMDGAVLHMLLHAPRSGVASGIYAGMIGHGKTGSVLVGTAETGLAKLCRICGPARTCRRCQMERIFAVWVGDPQRQPLVVMKGRADLTAWGPKACVLMMLWGLIALRSRGLGDTEWTDHLGRVHEGKGWFDPTPQVPGLQITVDEWPRIVALPELSPLATMASSEITSTSRKAGEGLFLVAQLPDLPYTGDRATRELLLAFNVICHRTDGLSKSMLGIEGEPSHLPSDVPGLCYMNGPDNRPATKARVKLLPEVLKPGMTGVDARDVWDQIATEPVTLEAAVMDAIGPLGYTGGGQVLRDEDITESMWRAALTAVGLIPGSPPGPAPAPPSSQPATGTVSLDTAARARRALERTARDNGATVEPYDLMQATGMSLGMVLAALDALVETGDAVRTADGRFAVTGSAS